MSHVVSKACMQFIICIVDKLKFFEGMEYKGLVLASKVKSRNVFSDIGAGFKSMVGGEIKGMSKLTSDLRDELLWELKEKAANIGANAVVGLR